MAGQFFVLFAMVGIGYFAHIKGIITPVVNTGIGALVMKLTCPALLFVTIATSDINFARLRAFFLLVAAQYIAALLGGKLLRGYSQQRGWEAKYAAMIEITTATANNGFIGLPVALLFFGETAGFYMSAVFFGIHLYLWTYAVHALQAHRQKNATARDSLEKLLNPNCVMVFVGLAFALCGWTPYLPQCVMEAASLLGNMSTPLSLMYIGAMASAEGIGRLLRKRDALEIAFLRMLLFPIVTAALVFFLPIDPLIRVVCMVSMACPCAAIMPMVVEQYGECGKEKASDIVLLTTVLSMGVLPVFVALSEFLLR